MRPDVIGMVKGSLESLDRLAEVEPGSEEFITDMDLIFALSNYCHDILYALLTIGTPRFFHQV